MLGIDDWWRHNDREDSGNTKHGEVAATISGLGIRVSQRPQQRWSMSSTAVVEGDNGFGSWQLLGFGVVGVDLVGFGGWWLMF